MSKEVILSDRTKKSIQKLLSDLKHEFKTEMTISGLTGLRISLDLSLNKNMPFMGVRIDASKHQSEEFIYDEK